MKNTIIGILCVALIFLGALIYIGTHDIKTTEPKKQDSETNEEVVGTDPNVRIEYIEVGVEHHD